MLLSKKIIQSKEQIYLNWAADKSIYFYDKKEIKINVSQILTYSPSTATDNEDYIDNFSVDYVIDSIYSIIKFSDVEKFYIDLRKINDIDDWGIEKFKKLYDDFEKNSDKKLYFIATKGTFIEKEILKTSLVKITIRESNIVDKDTQVIVWGSMGKKNNIIFHVQELIDSVEELNKTIKRLKDVTQESEDDITFIVDGIGYGDIEHFINYIRVDSNTSVALPMQIVGSENEALELFTSGKQIN